MTEQSEWHIPGWVVNDRQGLPCAWVGWEDPGWCVYPFGSQRLWVDKGQDPMHLSNDNITCPLPHYVGGPSSPEEITPLWAWRPYPHREKV